MLSVLLDLLFPRRSLTGDEGEFVTESEVRSCRSSPVIVTQAQLRKEGMLFLDGIVAVAEYKKISLLHRAVHTLKYKKVRGVGEALGKMLAETSALCFPSPQPSPTTVGEGGRLPVLCPVPLHWIRKFSRGFNQSEVLASVVARERKWEVKNLLTRTRWTGSQVGRQRKERLIGVRNAFMVRKGMTMPDHVILVDDLSTTGATLDACAKVLKIAGVKKVEGLVIALG